MSTGKAQIQPGGVHVFGFDSLSATLWFNGQDNASGVGHPNLPDQINANWNQRRGGANAGRAAVNAGVAAKNTAANVVHKNIIVINSGVSGNRIADVNADLNNRVISHAPAVVWFFCTLNDLTGKLGATTPTDLPIYMAAVATFEAAVHAALPNCQIIFMGAMCAGELWAEGSPPTFSGNTFDASFTTFNAAVQAFALATPGCFWAGIRDWAISYEHIHNWPAPGAASGVITRPGDGAHQRQVGALAMCDFMYSQVEVLAA